jgi:hypothetical protein
MIMIEVVEDKVDEVLHDVSQQLLIAHLSGSLFHIGSLGSTRAIAHCSSELAHILILLVFD